MRWLREGVVAGGRGVLRFEDGLVKPGPSPVYEVPYGAGLLDRVILPGPITTMLEQGSVLIAALSVPGPIGSAHTAPVSPGDSCGF
jgi:hypothetical protein